MRTASSFASVVRFLAADVENLAKVPHFAPCAFCKMCTASGGGGPLTLPPLGSARRKIGPSLVGGAGELTLTVHRLPSQGMSQEVGCGTSRGKNTVDLNFEMKFVVEMKFETKHKTPNIDSLPPENLQIH